MIKKSVITFVLTLLILFLIKKGVIYYNDNFSKMSKVSYKEITTIDDMDEIINSNKEVYVYMGRANCVVSAAFEKYFVDMVKDNNIDNLYYFNIKEITDQYEINNVYKTMLKKDLGINFTPTLTKYKNWKLDLKSEWTVKKGYNKSMSQKLINESGILDD
ncbi:MAG: DUF6568 family protein [Bacilli bacterium]